MGNVEKYVLICYYDIIKFYYKNDFGIVGKIYFFMFLFFNWFVLIWLNKKFISVYWFSILKCKLYSINIYVYLY